MAKTTVAIDLKATTSGAQSVKSLKQEIREAQQEAVALARKFGEFSPEATKAAQRMAQLKDEMDDFKERVAGLHPDKFNRFATIATGIAGGIQAATGAMALFGDESEDVQKALVKVQGAMAFGQGMEQLMAMRNTFGVMAGEIKTKLVTAFTTAAGAARLLGQALGVGLLVTAVTWLVNNFDKVKQKVEDLKKAIPGLSTVLTAAGRAWDWFKNKVQGFTDSIGLTDSKQDAIIKKIQKNIEFLRRQAAIDEALGKDTFESKRAIIQEELNLLQMQKAEEDKIIEKRQELRLLEAQRTKELADKRATAAEKAATAAKLAAEKEAEAKAAQIEAARKAAEELAALEEKRIADRKAATDKEYSDGIQSIEDYYQQLANVQNQRFVDGEINAQELAANLEDIEKQKNLRLIQEQEDYGKSTLEIQSKTLQKQVEEKKKADDELAKSEKATQDAILAAKMAGFQASSQLFSAAADLAREGSALQKGLALTSIAIDTAKAVSSTIIEARATAANYTKMGVPAPFPQIAGAAVYASGISMVMSNIRRAKQLINGGGSFSPSGSGASVGAAPSFAPTTFGELPDEATNMAGMGRVFVLEGDITKTQGRVRRLRNTSVV
jgi:DNA repair exonuclease SbcCD ATPase subunit